jgi:hypothetical protein
MNKRIDRVVFLPVSKRMPITAGIDTVIDITYDVNFVYVHKQNKLVDIFPMSIVSGFHATDVTDSVDTLKKP